MEFRKVLKDFIDFIKSSQRFYRGYVKALACHYGIQDDLKDITATLTPDDLSTQSTNETRDQLHDAIIASCHQALVRLGDLSRWRETQYPAKKDHWGPAINYYELAKSLDIRSGVSHNQLAVIASVGANHLGTLYHLYRALVARNPYPGATGNLTVELKRLCESQRRSEAVPSVDNDPHSLVTSFLHLHICCLERADISRIDDIQSDYFVKLEASLRGHIQDEVLERMILISIAAEYVAGVRLQGEFAQIL